MGGKEAVNNRVWNHVIVVQGSCVSGGVQKVTPTTEGESQDVHKTYILTISSCLPLRYHLQPEGWPGAWADTPECQCWAELQTLMKAATKDDVVTRWLTASRTCFSLRCCWREAMLVSQCWWISAEYLGSGGSHRLLGSYPIKTEQLLPANLTELTFGDKNYSCKTKTFVLPW